MTTIKKEQNNNITASNSCLAILETPDGSIP
jgi:hypothetical protein